MSGRYLVCCTIGPVQEFISAARKTRDLFAGSRLLSEASKQCALYWRERKGQLIFPGDSSSLDDRQLVVANKVLLEWTGGEPAGVTKGCKLHLQEWLQKQFSELSLERRIDPAFEYLPDLAKAQLEHVLEFYSAWVEFEGSDYPEKRKLLDRILEGRKNLRDFEAHAGSTRPKSSLDGNRETVIRFRSNQPLERFAIQTDEMLDGLGVFKRFWGEPPKFESTHDVAAAPFLASLPAGRQQMYEDEIRRVLRDVSFSHIYHQDKDLRANPAVAGFVQGAVNRIKGGRTPQPPYYGVLAGDGDRMGEAIGRLGSPDEHRKFSTQLSTFAGEAGRQIETLGAEPVFAGGDDVLAFLPLHKALECMHEVRAAFRTSMQGIAGVSFSAGLAVCHAMEPLTEARRSAAAAEQAAKAVPGKDAFCVTVVPRSGAPVSFAGKWDESFGFLRRVAELYARTQLTLSLAHDLRKLCGEWADAAEPIRETLDGHLRDMAIAIAVKKQTSEEALQLIRDFFALGKPPRESLVGLMSCLYVARPFARAMREARQHQGHE